MFNWNRKMPYRSAAAAAVAALALTLTACGGNSDDLNDLTLVATTNVTAAANANTTSAVVGTGFVFSSGVPELSTASATTVTFTAASDTTPSFKIESTEGTATGTTTFGSCIFTVAASTYPSTHTLGLGAVVRISTCVFDIQSAGVVIGAAQQIPLQFTLGSAASIPQPLAIQIGTDGQVTLGNRTLGQVTVGEASGASGGGN